PEPAAVEPAATPVAAGAPMGGAIAPAPPAREPASVASSVPDRGPRSQILSPLVRRLAREHSLDLGQIAGTGTGGRITKTDVFAVIASGGTSVSTAPAVGATATAPAPAIEPP